jgi:hypothetical protein
MPGIVQFEKSQYYLIGGLYGRIENNKSIFTHKERLNSVFNLSIHFKQDGSPVSVNITQKFTKPLPNHIYTTNLPHKFKDQDSWYICDKDGHDLLRFKKNQNDQVHG